MLFLRLLLMVLAIICLMDGHAEVSSSTTGMRNGDGNPAAKLNKTEIKILDRKKKKGKGKGKKKPGKPSKGKGKGKGKKKVTTTPLTTTLKKTSTTTPPTTITTTVTTTAEPTTTATTTTTAPTTTLQTTTTSATTTAQTITSPPTTPDYGDCEATNGSPCIFPFKDGSTEYNECANEKGRYYWCATSVYSSGKYKSWQYCPLDGSCPLPGGDCKATNKMPCYFPFKHDGEEYNECVDDGKKLWCATSTTSSGYQNNWGYCPDDGTCPLPVETTTPVMAPTTTTPMTSGSTTASEQMEEKVDDTIEYLVLGESRDDSLQMAHMLDKKLDNIIKDLEGETSKTEQFDTAHNLLESGNVSLTIRRGQDDNVRDGTELGVGLMFVLSSVDSDTMKSVSRVSGDCCKDCASKYPDTELAEYWNTVKACFCYKKLKIGGIVVEPKTRPSSKFTTKTCDTTNETNECCETLTITSTGGTAEHQGARLGTYKKDGVHNGKPVYKQQGGSKILFFSEQIGFEWVVGSSVNSGGGLRSKPGEDPACPGEAKQWEYYVPGTTNTWIVDSTTKAKCDGGFACLGKQSRVLGECPEKGWSLQQTKEETKLYILDEPFVIDKTKNPFYNIDACAARCKDNCDAFSYQECSLNKNNEICTLWTKKPEEKIPNNLIIKYKDIKDYCERGSSCSSDDENSKLKLICHNGYTEFDNAPSLYLLKGWTYQEGLDAKECSEECDKNNNCNASVSTICKGCQLLTENEHSTLSTLKVVNHYCLRGTFCEQMEKLVSPCPAVGYRRRTSNYYSNRNEYLYVIRTDVIDITVLPNYDINDCALSCESTPGCKLFSYEFYRVLQPCPTCPGRPGPCSHRVCTLLYQDPNMIITETVVNGNIPNFCELVLDRLLFVAAAIPPLLPVNVDLQVLDQLRQYADTCCQNDLNDSPGHPIHCSQFPVAAGRRQRQRVFVAWVPKNSATQLADIQRDYAPGRHPHICNHHFASIQMRPAHIPPGALESLHTEEMLLPLISPILAQAQPMNIYLFTYNSPCSGTTGAAHVGSTQGNTPGCIPRIFEYYAGTHCNNFLNRNFRSMKHSMKVGFLDFWDSARHTCRAINTQKQALSVHTDRLRFYKISNAVAADRNVVNNNPC